MERPKKMKTKFIYTFLMSVCMFVLFIGISDVKAINTGFSTEELSAEDIETVLANVNISVFTEEPKKQAIKRFDINEDGLIALGFDSSNYKTVCIYTSDGEFLYGYNFETRGTFGVEWNKNILIIHLVRSDVSIAVNQNGEVEGIAKIQNTSENNDYWRNSIFLSSKKVNNNTYTIKNDMGLFNMVASSYSQLVVTDEDGTETILYDVNSEQYIKTAVCTCGVFLWFTLALIFSVKKLRKKNTTA